MDSNIECENDGYVYINRLTEIHWNEKRRMCAYKGDSHKKSHVHIIKCHIIPNEGKKWVPIKCWMNLVDCWWMLFVFAFFHVWKSITLKFHKFQIDIASYIRPSIDFGWNVMMLFLYCSPCFAYSCLFGSSVNRRSAFYYSKIWRTIEL